MNKARVRFRLIVVFLIVMLCFVSIQASSSSSMEYEVGVYPKEQWDDNTWIYYEGEMISDTACAVDLAATLFTHLPQDGWTVGYKPQAVFYDDQEKLWIVSFWQDYPMWEGEEGDITITLMPCLNIALSSKDASVVKIWVEE